MFARTYVSRIYRPAILVTAALLTAYSVLPSAAQQKAASEAVATLQVLSARDVSIAGHPGLELQVELIPNKSENLSIHSNEICIVTTKQENKCDWSYTHFFSLVSTSGSIGMTTLRVGNSFPMVSSLDGDAELKFELVEGIRSQAVLLFEGLDKAHAVFFRLGSIAAVKVRASETATSQPSLFSAAANGNLEKVRSLLAAHADVSASLDDGRTALMLAAENGHLGVARALLAAKADVNAKSFDGSTAFALAAKNNHLDMVRLLEGAGAKRVVVLSAAEAVKRLVESAPPIYPPIAKAAHISGTVVLQATISKTGSIENLHVVSGPTMLQKSAMDAVKTWRYMPYLLNNQPVEVDTTVNVIFTLGG
jgi:TonB family protein